MQTHEKYAAGVSESQEEGQNSEAPICLQDHIRASRGLPVSGGSQVDKRIRIIQLCCQVFFQVEHKFVTLEGERGYNGAGRRGNYGINLYAIVVFIIAFETRRN